MGRYHHSCFRRPVFKPKGPVSLADDNISESDISSLPDLIRFNARENPDHVFAIQSELREAISPESEDDRYGVQITFKQLDEMVRACESWIRIAVMSSNQYTKLGEQAPIAIYMESGVGLFLYLAALLSMNIPALLISARLSSPSVQHLLKKTNSKAILVSRRTSPSLSKQTSELAQIVQVEPYSAFMAHSSQTHETEDPPNDKSRYQSNGQRTALILHSSGTTGLPKPIFLPHRYLLGYAACHQFAHDEETNWVNLSTLPMYHGFGLLAPCLSLSIGMIVCFPPSSTIPATKSIMDLIRTFNCRSLMTVPSIVEDILCQPDEHERREALKLLAKLEFLAVGGGALKPEHGIKLAKHQIKLLNHYGVTEIGAIAPIFRPQSDYNWKFLRLRSDLGLELHPIPNSKYYRLVGYPIGCEEPFEVQDELERNDASSHVEIRILGRTDDVIVLKTGEKIQPRQLEDALNADPAIKTAVCVGSGFFELAVVIDPINENADDETTKEQAWKIISAMNPSIDHHARIISKNAIIVKPKGKTIPRSDKGSVMRQRVHEIFKEEIEDAYAAMELDTLGDGPFLDFANIEMGIRRLLPIITSNRLDGKRMSAEEDFFESGMDSLQTVHFSRYLGSGLRKLREERGSEKLQISADFIYRNPSIKKLTAGIASLINSEGEVQSGTTNDRIERIKAVSDEFMANLDRQLPSTEHTILMTGSTGNLGAHTLAKLTRIRTIGKIICLVRGQQTVSDGATSTFNVEGAESFLLSRQRSALEAAGIHLAPEQWAKVELLELSSIVGESETIELAEQSFVTRKATEPVRLLFSSSIAVARYYRQRGDNRGEDHVRSIVPESAILDPLVSMPMGYAEAKWVCEMYLDCVAKRLLGIEPVIVRVGQLSGPEKTSGVWKTEEHIPTLVHASQKIGAFPEMEGTASWMPVDRAASSLSEILMCRGKTGNFLHLENPVRQPLKDIFTIMANELGLQRPFMVPFEQWLQSVTVAGEIRSLESFYKDHFHQLAGGTVTLDTAKARTLSNGLMRSGGIDKDLIREYVHRWRRDGFLK
ncbi:hypothetical protein FHL15_005800 [Xylaria flabelliformis]|uniref:Carrier domain-containing protein n=1 Tax=Xylaria flabelliformis TaxID=2512241 RepID=A0A553HZ47_9PEZI|nr:hypothetical protein FHL15_005800 [Xylaria flabelliformis]